MKTLFMLIACLLGISPWAVGQFPSQWDFMYRQTNTAGDIRILPREYDGTNLVSEQQISFTETNRQLPNLSLRNVHFLDAKFDPKRDKVAVLVSDGRPYLRYQRYHFTNSNWQQELDVRLVRFDSTFESKGNVLELSKFDTVRATFLRRGEEFSQDQPRGVERKDDLEYLFRVTDTGMVLVNDRDITLYRSWSPNNTELKTGPRALPLDEPTIDRLKSIRAKLRPILPGKAKEVGPKTLAEAARFIERVLSGGELHTGVEHGGVFYFPVPVNESDNTFSSGFAIEKGDTTVRIWIPDRGP